MRRILIAVDSSPASMRAVNWVRRTAEAETRVLIVSVADSPHSFIPLGPLPMFDLGAVHAGLVRDANDALVQASSVFGGSDIPVETHLIDLATRGGDIAHAIVEMAEVWHADLLVVGARQHHGLLRWAEGTVSTPLTGLATCSIAVVPASYEMDAPLTARRILFAVDGSGASLQALKVGAQFASADTQVRAVYVVDKAARVTDLGFVDPLEEAFVAVGEMALTRAAGVFAGLQCTSETALLGTEPTNDDVSHAIVGEAMRWNADLIVMGTHGRRGLARWLLGSVAARVASITQTPLLLVHARTD